MLERFLSHSVRTSTIIAAVLVACTTGATLSAPPTALPGLGRHSLTTAENVRGGKIVGGEPAKIQDIPWQVSIEEFGFHVCGGSIYNRDYVITAASCVYGSEPFAYQIIAGTIWSTSTEDAHVRQVDDIIVHPSYNDRTMENDLALLKLNYSLDVTSDPAVGYVTLPAQNASTAAGSQCIVSGWGRTDNDSVSSVLQYTTVPILDDSVCKESYFGLNAVADTTLCAGFINGGSDACQGDSGGPLVIKGTSILVGIVSWGHGCGIPDFPGVYTKVSSFSDWIKNIADTVSISS